MWLLKSSSGFARYKCRGRSFQPQPEKIFLPAQYTAFNEATAIMT